MVTTDTQTFSMNGSDTLGFSIVGTNGNAGADIQVGQTGGNITDAAIVLTGDKYESRQVNVQSGLLEIGQNTILGTDDSILTIGSSNASDGTVTASVNNRGQSTMTLPSIPVHRWTTGITLMEMFLSMHHPF